MVSCPFPSSSACRRQSVPAAIRLPNRVLVTPAKLYIVLDVQLQKQCGVVQAADLRRPIAHISIHFGVGGSGNSRGATQRTPRCHSGCAVMSGGQFLVPGFYRVPHGNAGTVSPRPPQDRFLACVRASDSPCNGPVYHRGYHGSVHERGRRRTGWG
jgi:hypothetical protein